MAAHRLAVLARATRSAAASVSHSHPLGTRPIARAYGLAKHARRPLAVVDASWGRHSVASVHTCTLAPMNTRELLLRSLFDEFSKDGVHVDHESMHTVRRCGARGV